MSRQSRVVAELSASLPALLPEELEQQIVALSAAVKKMTSGRVKERAVLLLLVDQSGVKLTDAKRILDALRKMDEVWLVKENK